MEHLTFTSANGQTPLHVCFWTTKTKPIGVVQLIHGMTEYIERYHEFAKRLTDAGFVVIGHDHLGHGESVDPNEPIYGYFGDDGAHLMLEDIDQVKQWTQKKYPDLPYFMMGHSMGSFALRTYLQRYPVQIQGAIIMGTGTRPAALALGKPFVNRLAKTNPKKPAEWINNLAFGSFSKPFKEASSFSWLSKNPENIIRYEADPKLGFTFTFNGFATLFSLIESANQKNWMDDLPRTLPMLIVSGQEDPVGDFGKGPKKIAAELTKKGFHDVTLKLFPTLRHEILLEDEKEVDEYIIEWIEKRAE